MNNQKEKEQDTKTSLVKKADFNACIFLPLLEIGKVR
tara:strand:+ start:2044 stop:2154 length:111 start_codon:yes stop_codon:yes gene_type:complete